jgi:iron complex outermembrane recepter protein
MILHASRAVMLGFAALASVADLMAQGVSPVAALKQLSLEELLKVEVTTVSRRPERWWVAPSGIDVVTGEDIRRAGVSNLPDALRLATSVHVGQSSARSWAVSVRGMNVLAANKISVAMDGRSLFTPFFSGVLWDAQDTLLEDIDRIEVVRGPVGALWGAFAVNGFVQILTKPAWDTQGSLLSVGAGTEAPVAISLRHGGQAGEHTFYRVYAKYFQADWTYDESGRHAQPATDFLQLGFRTDSTLENNAVMTMHGDYYTNQDLWLDRVQTEINGANLVARWRRGMAPGRELHLEGYVDHTYRLIPFTFEETRDTASATAKFHATETKYEYVVGADAVVSRDEIGNIGLPRLEPPERTVHTVSVFGQGTWRTTPTMSVIGGAKVEHNAFSGFEWQPTIRLLWIPHERATSWAAVSRAVRTPVRIDEDLVFRVGPTAVFDANDDFGTEETFAYELGGRFRPGALPLTFEASLFHYRYGNLRSTEPSGATALPLTFRNLLNAESSGGEVKVMFQPSRSLFVKGTYRYLDLEFSRDEGSRDASNGRSEGNDPRHLGIVQLHASLGPRWEFDAYLRFASALPDPATEGYEALDLRLGWHVTEGWELSLVARNLLDDLHRELRTTNSLNEHVRRSVALKATWRR